MQTGDALEPERVAAAIAPIIDRLRMAVVVAIRPTQAEIAERTGIPGPVLGPVGMLRNAMPDRVLDVDDVLEVFPYQPPDQVRSGIDAMTAAGLTEAVDSGRIRLGATGRNIVAELFERIQSFIDGLWAGQADLVGALVPLAVRVCAAVSDTGGGAVRVMTPQYQPSNASPALQLVEALSPLRFHRSDAHIAAWRAEGLTADQMQQLAPGPQRERIEAETNRLAAPPYSVLTADERFTLLSGLGALPN